MSFILDALNKAQRERQEQRQPVPQLSTVHYTPPTATVATEKVRPPKIMVIAGLAVVVLIALVGYWWMTGSAPGVEPAAQSAAVAAAPLPVTPAPSVEPEPNSIAESAESSTPENPVVVPETDAAVPPAEVTNLYQTARVAPAPAATPTAALTTTSAPTTTQAQTAARSTVGTQAQDPAVQAAEALALIRARHQAQYVPASQSQELPTQSQIQAQAQIQSQIQAPEVEPEPAPQHSITSRLDVPFVQELSWTLQQTLPTINYSAHNYSADTGQHSVDINGTTYRAGSQVGGGLVVEEILSDGVILRFKGEAVKLRALNSWMNF